MEEETDWNTELEQALLEECDFGSLRNICKGRPIPGHLRRDVWQICLQVQGKGDALTSFDRFFDLPEQNLIRQDCAQLVDKLGNEDEEKVSVVADLESIVTFFCKSRQETYTSDNGWLDILQPLISLNLGKSELYNCFYSILNKYVPRDCKKNGKPFHLFRLLLQYHDPELCVFLDTKRITPDIFAHIWFRSLFASICDLKVTLNMWDVYLQTSDPFLSFFMALVILVNARDQLLDAETKSKQEIVDLISAFPTALEAGDIEDFCSLAQYYASKTPQSFRRDYEKPLFGTSLGQAKTSEELELKVSQMLCLPVSAGELLQSNHAGGGDGVRYFVIDCRPAEQYNSGHLHTAMHLDANLMLQNPEEFNTAVQALFSAQQQALLAGSAAGGEHLCFVGSGREEEDQYVHMVVANFLQKHQQYVSFARGGYFSLHNLLQNNLSEGLVDHNTKSCIVCRPELANHSDTESAEDFKPVTKKKEENEDSFFGRLSSAVKSKSTEVKEKLTNYIKNEQMYEERHVSNTDRVGKRYRNMASVFTIGDEEEGEEGEGGMMSDEERREVVSLETWLNKPDIVYSCQCREVDSNGFLHPWYVTLHMSGSGGMMSDEERREVVSLETWLNKPDIVFSCQCREVDPNGFLHPSHLLLTDSHLYILRDIPKKKGMVFIQGRRALGSIVKITSKKRHPEFITFSYGSNEEEGVKVTSCDRCIIQHSGEATKRVKQQIMKVLDALES